MTFEEEYGRWLAAEINERTFSAFGLKCRQYNELSFKPLAKNPDEIALIISGGGAARSTVRGQDQNSGTFSVVVLCQKKYMEYVQSAVAAFQQEYNAMPLVMSYKPAPESEDMIINAKSVFFTPIVLDAQDYPTKEHGTLKAVFMQFTATVLYGTTAVVAPVEYKLSVDGVFYVIEHIASYDNASMPSYDSYLAQGEDRNKQIAVAKNNSWAITIYKTSEENELQTILENEAYGQEGGLWGKSIVLQKDGINIPIQTYQLNESYVDNAAAYVLTLMA